MGLLGVPMVVQAPPSVRMRGPCQRAGTALSVKAARAEQTAITMRGADNVRS